MEIKENIPLASYTNFKVGGPARFFVEVRNVDELQTALQFAKEKDLPHIVLGGGMNVLVSDDGFAGLVIRVSCSMLHVSGDHIVADAGCTMGQVVAAAQKTGLTGLEWAVGLPGTVGGAVYGNSGCFGGETKDAVESVELMNPTKHEVRSVKYGELEPAYRHTKLMETAEIVLSATFKLKAGNREEIAAMVERIRQKSRERIAEQPLGTWTAGSTFKGVEATEAVRQKLRNAGVDWKGGLNRAGFISAGFLIERAGLKGLAFGDAEFSARHANFIMNRGGAAAVDIKALIDTAKEMVYNMFGVSLEEEIQYIGFDKIT